MDEANYRDISADRRERIYERLVDLIIKGDVDFSVQSYTDPRCQAERLPRSEGLETVSAVQIWIAVNDIEIYKDLGHSE